ncbi:hypothetical protein QA601_02050 [Chitinispirillales bacterium ANBcel5]|uniref:hypothetical protein n=1 Tax=Cellulosispirillum alkaliphilum TaxID=3039283 RepID=UPI002A553823|nr:hypothetical protein [Chitinispirillales bacterium ANBcel5]
MSKILSIIPLLILFSTVYAQIKVEVEREGRRIQVDGFLVEWNPEHASPWPQTPFTFDVIYSPEGIAGYFSSLDQPVCSVWVFSATPQEDLTFNFSVPPTDTHSDLYAIDMLRYDSLGTLTMEWLIPFDELEIDQQGNYRVQFDAVSDCNDTLPTLIFTGTIDQTIFTPGMVIQGILIVILIVVYVFVWRWVRSRTRRRGSPHQSA